jgi:hypothetical protein
MYRRLRVTHQHIQLDQALIDRIRGVDPNRIAARPQGGDHVVAQPALILGGDPQGEATASVCAGPRWSTGLAGT